jgi:transcriptional regulator
MQDLPEAYLQTMLNGIVGLEIAVTRLEGKYKLSQNRLAADRSGVIAALEARPDAGSQEVSRLMRLRGGA